MIIIVDLDSTLLTSDKKITDYTLRVFRKAQERGHKIIVNTARSLKLTYKYSKMLNADYIVCFNGNLVLDKFGNFYSEKKLDENTARKLIEFSVKNGIENIRIDTKTNIFSNNLDYCLDNNFEYVSTEKLIELSPIAYTLLFDRNPSSNFDKMEKFAEENGVLFGYSRDLSQSWFMPAGTEKWEGVKIAIGEISKTEKHKTIAFGDELTDVITFMNVDYPVPLLNSTEEVLDMFEKTTKHDNDNNGVAIWLEENLLI